jgi:hypothetical protein
MGVSAKFRRHCSVLFIEHRAVVANVRAGGGQQFVTELRARIVEVYWAQDSPAGKLDDLLGRAIAELCEFLDAHDSLG